MEGFNLLSINNNQIYQELINEGFRFVRFCGLKTEGLLNSITIGYIDNLILSQSTHQNNFKFLDQK